MTAKTRTANAHSGSPSTGEPEYLVVGTLRRPHGLHGEMLMEVITDFPERLRPGVDVFLGERHLPKKIGRIRGHAQGLLIEFPGIETAEAAGAYRRQHVYVAAANRPALPKGQYYHHELIGCTVVDENGQPIGQLGEIIETGANDVYVVSLAADKEMLLPAISGVILELDPGRRLIRARVPEGLADDSMEQGQPGASARIASGKSSHPDNGG